MVKVASPAGIGCGFGAVAETFHLKESKSGCLKDLCSASDFSLYLINFCLCHC